MSPFLLVETIFYTTLWRESIRGNNIVISLKKSPIKLIIDISLNIWSNMGLVELLKKIGILKTWNSSGTYKKATERPDKFVEKDLYDGAESQVYDSDTKEQND